MFLAQHGGVVKAISPKMSTPGRNERTPEEWLYAVLYSGQVTRVGQHLALVLFHLANEKGVAELSLRDLQSITGWGRTTIYDHLGEIETFIKTSFGEDVVVFELPFPRGPDFAFRLPPEVRSENHPERVRQSTKRLEQAVWKKTHGRCTYCGVHLNPFDRMAPDGFHIDHAIPYSRGGTDDLENLVPACRICNFSKSASTPEEWEARRAAQ